ncbi:MAG: alpha/beta hydrolase [Prevotellaceae bacterium]|jgi:pimeloyl-ACP methyl ester carboxylesterase|nr:alpha/beta hydrolase [Prevotellaceae bacterium]
MKIRTNIILILVLFALPHITVYAQQNRNVIWVHGLGDNSLAWKHYADIFAAERRIYSHRESFKTSSGLDSAAIHLKAFVTSTAPTNLGIGHSMGGLMIREVDRTTSANDKRFGGFITVASPNYGAPVSDNILKGAQDAMIETAVKRLAAGFIAELGGALGEVIWKFIFADWTVKKITDALRKNTAMMDTTANKDLKEGSPAMDALNNFNSTAHKIAIIAEETSPVHWRMAGSAVFGAGTSVLAGDEEMVWVANQTRKIYNDKVKQHEVVGFIALFLNPPAIAHHNILKNAWKEGRDWLDQSETIWCSLIKSSKTYYSTVIWEEWVPCASGGVFPAIRYPHQPAQPLLCDYWISHETICGITVNYKSDGLLPTYAQELKDCPAGNRYVIDHANHMEVLNMSYSRKNGVLNDGTYKTFEAIFNRGDWFNTEKKTQ